MSKILSIENLTVAIGQGKSQVVRLHQVSLDLYEREFVGLVGRSGAGKSLTGMSILGLHKDMGGVILGGKIFYWLNGEKVELSSLSTKAYTQIRGKQIGIIFQEASTALNPTQKLGKQLIEAYALSNSYIKAESKNYVIDLMYKVKIEDPERIFDSYPHEVSGGQAQRVMIAMCLCLQPSIIIADEPTSSLDSVTQREIVDLLKGLSIEYNFAMIWISHNLPLTQYLCDRVVRIEEGRIVDPHAQQGISPTPKLPSAINSSLKKVNQKLLSFDSVSKYYRRNRWSMRQKGSVTRAVEKATFVLAEGQLLGLIGRSGSGKSTMARLIIRLLRPTEGRIIYNDTHLDHFTAIERKMYSKDVQIIYQNPEASLDPRWKIYDVLNEPIQVHSIYATAEESLQAMKELLAWLQLPEDTLERHPHQFSGGQRQRIAIARALLIKPRILVCDECIASLDADNQRIILDVIKEYNHQYKMSVLFISHNLAIVKDLVDEILIMKEGRIIHHVLANNLHSITDEYVQDLLTSCEF